ncbi:MAG: hypothetical protein JXA93_01580 [Anaerolineae bacterium]|nr:hypothetical protein [Anaerolineae bacterium]
MKCRRISVCVFQFCPAVCLLVAMAVATSPTLARAGTPGYQDVGAWTQPENLSQQGGASRPVITWLPNGHTRIVWWDHYAGFMMVSDGVEDDRAAKQRWSAPQAVSLLAPQADLESLDFHLIGADGTFHAMWVGLPDAESGNRALLSSRLAHNAQKWSDPTMLAASAISPAVAAGPSGELHAAYVRPNASQRERPGVYYLQSINGEGTWSAPKPVIESDYFRLVDTEESHLQVSVDGEGIVYIVWRDPRRAQLMVSESNDAGATWKEPRPYTVADEEPVHGQLVAVPGRSRALVWEGQRAEVELLAASTVGDALILSAWNGEQWLSSRHISFLFADPETGVQVTLSGLSAALAPAQEDRGTETTLMVTGVDQGGDVWVLGTETGPLEDSFVPAAPDRGSDDSQGEPALGFLTNLSQSGAATEPQIVSGAGDAVRAFWWDQFDGLTLSEGTLSFSEVVTGTETTGRWHAVWSQPQPIPLPDRKLPALITDIAGYTHAFWLGPGKNSSGQQVLKHARLTSDRTAWTFPSTVAPSAAIWRVVPGESGQLHLVYIHTQHTPSAPAGVFYRHFDLDREAWSTPVVIQESRYFRLLSTETAHLDMATKGRSIYVTWDTPGLEQLVLAYSVDEGNTWDIVTPTTAGQDHPSHGMLVQGPGDEMLLLWEGMHDGPLCFLYQTPVDEIEAGAILAGEQVLKNILACPSEHFVTKMPGQETLLVAGGGSDYLTLAAWDSEQWSDPKSLTFSFQRADGEKHLFLGQLRGAVASAPGDSKESQEERVLVVVGTDQHGDVWGVVSEQNILQMVFSPPSPWSPPVRLAETSGIPNATAISTTGADLVHVMWTQEGTLGQSEPSIYYTGGSPDVTGSGGDETAADSGLQWTPAAAVVASPEGGASQVALAAGGDHVHAAWVAGFDSEVMYSRSLAQDAYSAAGWTDPVPLPSPASVVSWPDIAVEGSKTSHVVFAVPVNEERGIYHVASTDGGEHWSDVHRVFDAARAGWTAVDYPRLAVDHLSRLHCVWVETGLSGLDLASNVYYAHSDDSGGTWSTAQLVAESGYGWPKLVTSSTGQVHLLLHETGEANAWWHTWSEDGGETWTRRVRVPGFRGASGTTGVTTGGGAIHIVSMSDDSGNGPVLLHATWNGTQWSEPETTSLATPAGAPGTIAAIRPEAGRLDVIFQGLAGAGDDPVTAIWHVGRAISTTASLAAPTRLTPAIASTPVPPEETLTVPISPTATIESGVVARMPDSGSSDVPLPLLLAGGLSGLLVVGTLGVHVVRSRRSR